MQRTSQSQEKGLFTFYKQQEQLSYSFQNPNNEKKNVQVNNQLPQRIIKKKQKRSLSKFKQCIEKESQDQNKNFQPKQEKNKKASKKLKGTKSSKKKIISSLKLQSKTTQIKMSSKRQIICSKSRNSNQKSQSMIKQGIQLQKQEIKPLILTKKNIISDTNIDLKPFQKINFSEDDELLSKQIFEKSKIYEIRNEEKSKFIDECLNQTFGLIQDQTNQPFPENISQKFLSKVVRKNAQSSLQTYHKIIESEKKLKSSISENPQSMGESIKIICMNQNSSDGNILPYNDIFQNQHISKCFSPQKIQKYQSKQSNDNDLQRRKNPKVALKTKLIRMKTEVLKPIHSVIYGNERRFDELKKYTEDAVFTQNLLKDHRIKQTILQQKMSEFMSIHRSSFTVHQIPKKESIQIFESYEALQNQKKIKTKSRKLPRFSVLNSSESKNNKSKDISQINLNQKIPLRNQQSPLQKKIIKQVDLKLPEIHRNLSMKEKTSQNEQNYAIKSEQTSFLRNLNKHLIKQSDKDSKLEFKCRLRCYTQSDTTSKKASAANLNRNMSKNLSEVVKLQSKIQGKQVKEVGNLPKCWSSKIIENFHEVYYKRYYLEKERSQKVALLDMSENLIFNSRQSLDWQIKKKQLTKKLGIKI